LRGGGGEVKQQLTYQASGKAQELELERGRRRRRRRQPLLSAVLPQCCSSRIMSMALESDLF
jgi:hypothetical protein